MKETTWHIKRLLKKNFFSLAPSDQLDRQNNSNYSVYRELLKKAFKNDNIHNIAITGDFGVGKSSIIQTFDRRKDDSAFYLPFMRRLLKKKRYLYISSSIFDKWQNPAMTGSEEGGAVCQNHSADDFEKELISQILFFCDNSNAPYKLVSGSEKNGRRRCFAIVYTFLAICAYVLTFRQELSTVGSWLFDKFGNNFSVTGDLVYSILYLIMGVIASVLAYLGVFWISRRIQFKELSVGKGDTSVNLVLKEGTSYLNKYKCELIQVLESTAKKIGYTVVFEDLDRLDTKTQAAILEELRNINQLVNSRAAHRHNIFNRRLRFLYVMNTTLFNASDCAKFFDYVIPIIPSLSEYDLVDSMIYDYLPRLGIYIGRDEEAWRSFFAGAELYLSDYRTLHLIQNEYKVFDAIERTRGLNTDPKCLLAFVIYKTLCPGDYYKIRSGESAVFSRQRTSDKFIDHPFVRKLYHDNYLPPQSVRFLGYSSSQLKEYYTSILLSEDDLQKRNLLLGYVNTARSVSEQYEVFLCAEIILKVSEKRRAQMINGVQFAFIEYLLSLDDLTDYDKYVSVKTSSDLNAKARNGIMQPDLTESVRGWEACNGT